jgi:hypothetical protein
VPEAPNILQGHSASLRLALTQRRSVSSAEAPVLPPYLHPETPHGVPCPVETPATRSGNMGSRRGAIKGSTFSRSSQYLPGGVFPTFCTILKLNLKGYSQPSRPCTSRTPSSSPTARGRPHILHSLVPQRLTSHTSISRVPPHRTRCHNPGLLRLGSLFSRASLCRKQARREATTYKLPSVANETDRLAVNQTTSVSSSVRHTSHLQR